MAITRETVYENGVLKPTQPLPLPLKEHDRIQITIRSKTSWVEATYGICDWNGSAEEAERFATDPELAFPSTWEEP